MKKAICPICEREVTVDLNGCFWAHGEIAKQTAPGKIDWCPMSDRKVPMKVMGENAERVDTKMVDDIGYELYRSTESHRGMLRAYSETEGTLYITKYLSFLDAKATFEEVA